MTMRSIYENPMHPIKAGDTGRERLRSDDSGSEYLFVYPMVKTRPWYELPHDERQRIMNEHIDIGRDRCATRRLLDEPGRSRGTRRRGTGRGRSVRGHGKSSACESARKGARCPPGYEAGTSGFGLNAEGAEVKGGRRAAESMKPVQPGCVAPAV